MGLSGAPRDWTKLFKGRWMNYEDFKSDFLQTYWSELEQSQFWHALTTARWSPLDGLDMHAHFVKWARKAKDLTISVIESDLVLTLMNHFPTEIRSIMVYTVHIYYIRSS